ncbi:MAG: DUF3999 domain-containing protein [Desulfobacterales bacterium]|jgi:hypothetical protein|nr:DUF3999 domain-containing protein [Desulfobacterales bacterium]
MMVKNWIFLVLMLMPFWDIYAYAKDPAPEPVLEDFAYGISISVEGEGAICSLDIPEDVYRNVTRSDLGDIRVFNGQGEVVPHDVKGPDPLENIRKQPVQVPYFPLYAGIKNSVETKQRGVSLNINTDDRGTIIDVRTDGLDQNDQKIQAYLLDLSRIEEPIEAIELQWSKQEDDFNIQVSLDASADLNSWHRVVDHQSLAELNFSGQTLVKNKILFPVKTRKYLRMAWPAAAGGRELTGVSAIFPETAVDSPRQWLNATGKRIKSDRAVYEFDAGGMFPIDRFTIDLPEQNSLVQAIVQSRQKMDDQWHDRHHGLFYRISVDGGEISNDAVLLQPVPDRLWRMESHSEGAGLGTGMPALMLGWLKHRLMFLSRGNPPFILAYGAASVSPSDYSMDKLISQIRQAGNADLVQTAHAGDPFIIGGVDRLKPPEPPLPWKKWVLWAVLCASVVVLGLMAIRLFKQMNK